MRETLFIYSSTDGHTKNICERLTNFSSNTNAIKIISLLEATKFDLTKFNQIVIGASIRYGKYSKNLHKFINLNKDILEQKNSVFFSVNVVARKPEKNTPDTNPYVKKFLRVSKWKPKKIVTIKDLGKKPAWPLKPKLSEPKSSSPVKSGGLLGTGLGICNLFT